MRLTGAPGAAALIAAVLAIGVCSQDLSAQAGRGSKARQSATAVVKMTGDLMTFDPPRLVIRLGQSVDWQNQSNQLHNVVADATKANPKTDVELPKGAAPFGSALLKPGDHFTHRFTTRGTYRYVCTMHEVQGMKGEIVVK